MTRNGSQNKEINGRDAKSGQFLLGHTGAGGRPRGSRNRLGEVFVSDLYEQWLKHGKGVIDRVIRDDPAQFLKTIAHILPRQLDETLNVNVLFAEAKDFNEAYRMALKHIGSEIEIEAVNEPELIDAGTE